MQANEYAGPLAQSAFNFQDVPELVAWHGELEQRYPGRGYAVLHLTSVSLMVSDVRSYAFAETAGQVRDDIAEQMLACQSALVKVMMSLDVSQEDFVKTGKMLFRNLMLHARPDAGAKVN